MTAAEFCIAKYRIVISDKILVQYLSISILQFQKPIRYFLISILHMFSISPMPALDYLAYLAFPSAMKKKEYKIDINLRAVIQDLHSDQFKEELNKVLHLNILLSHS